MKHLKMLGLVAIAVLGLIAFVGAGTASATTLYTSSNLTNPYPAGTTFDFTLVQGHSVTFTNGKGEELDTCSESTFEWKTASESGTPLSGAIEQLGFGGCTTTTIPIALGSLQIEKVGTNEGKVVGKGLQATIAIFGVTCTYGFGSGTTLGTITGGTAPVLLISGATLVKTAGGFLCPSTAGFDADYIITSPHAVFIG